MLIWGLPSGTDGKECTCNVGDLGLIPGLGRYPAEGNGYPLQYSGLENSMDRRTWQATAHGDKKSQTWLRDFHLFVDCKITLQSDLCLPVYFMGNAPGLSDALIFHTWSTEMKSQRWAKVCFRLPVCQITASVTAHIIWSFTNPVYLSGFPMHTARGVLKPAGAILQRSNCWIFRKRTSWWLNCW